MPVVRQALSFGRYLAALPRFLRRTASLEDARVAVRRRLDERHLHLLTVARRGFYGGRDSPYVALLRHAGCEYADFERLVMGHGVEESLRRLRGAGVFVSFDEFKGRVPMVRGGVEIPLRPEQFDNGMLTAFARVTTGGSTGLGTPVMTELRNLAVQAEHRLLTLDAHGILDLPFAIWRPPLPSGSGIHNVLRQARAERPVRAWFNPLARGIYRPPRRHRTALGAIRLVSRAAGVAIPRQRGVPLADPLPIVHWLAGMAAGHGGAVLNTTVSGGLRVARAAIDEGVHLRGVYMMVSGEPATRAKLAGIRASGASHLTDYGMAESGRIGLGCARPGHPTDVHVTLDTVAVVPGGRPATGPGGSPESTPPGSTPVEGPTVDAFHVTSLNPTSPKLLLNVEFDDFGEMEWRPCGCPLGALGLDLRLRRIQSFSKLTGEGVTLVGTEMEHILESVLPERFGGTPLSYQLVERERDGLTRLALRVAPDVEIESPEVVKATFLAALSEAGVVADLAGAHWASGDVVDVLREAPEVSPRGKQFLIRRDRASAAASEFSAQG